MNTRAAMPPAAPRLSVLVLTCNHERFIERALESVLDQATRFELEIIIGDDCSGDCTTAIVHEFAKWDPRIRVVRPKRNLGMCVNFACTLAMCRGEYIALLEGDDYWTSPNKLQLQLDYLDSHEECSLAFHPVEVIGGKESGTLFPQSAAAFVTVKDLICGNVIPTCSVMFRRRALLEFPAWLATLKVLDWPLFVLLTQWGGKAGFLPHPMGAYRVHEAGVWSGMASEERSAAKIEVLQQLQRQVQDEHSATVELALVSEFRTLAGCLEQRGRLHEAFRVNWRTIRDGGCCKCAATAQALRLLFKIHAPSLYHALRRMFRSHLLPERHWSDSFKIRRDAT